MSIPGNHRLSSAAATLPLSDRALLDLWINRGLDDERLTDLTGLSADALKRRRERIVQRLSRELDVPAADVRATLRRPLAAGVSANSPSRGRDDVRVVGGPSRTNEPRVGRVATYVSDEEFQLALPLRARDHPAADAALARLVSGSKDAPVPPDRPTVERVRRRRRGLWLAPAAMVVAAILVIVLAGGPASRPRPGARNSPARRAVTTATVPAVSERLAALPGGPVGVAGTATLAGSAGSLKLNLTVSGLPPLASGHYEVWLYDSLIDSAPLGVLSGTTAAQSFPLPAGAARYAYIDISFQPPGAVAPSGASIARGPNPAAAAR